MRSVQVSTSKKKAVRLAVLSVGDVYCKFCFTYTYGLANAQQNKTSMQPQGVQSTQGLESTTPAMLFQNYINTLDVKLTKNSGLPHYPL